MLNLFRRKLPHCNELFERFVAHWLPDDYARDMPRPDMYGMSGFQGKTINLPAIQYLTEERLQIEKDQMDKMEAAALGDYQSIFPSDALTTDLLDAVDKYYDRARIADLIKRSDPTDFSNDYLVSIGQFGVMLGKLFEEKEGFRWLYSAPYFNSIIVHTPTGFALPVFDWAVKKFSEYGVDDGFRAKLNAAQEAVWRHASSR